MCICRTPESGWESLGSLSALDCRMVRQRRVTSSLRLDNPARKWLTLFWTKALVPRHRFLIASSALKSGL